MLFSKPHLISIKPLAETLGIQSLLGSLKIVSRSTFSSAMITLSVYPEYGYIFLVVLATGVLHIWQMLQVRKKAWRKNQKKLATSVLLLEVC